jgi:Regulator of ribonuclease activity B
VTEPELAHQLEMNRTTWAALQEHGVRDGTELLLDFFYFAPGQAEADALASSVRAETDYQVEVGSTKSGLLGKRSWHVNGTTGPTPASLAELDEWVTRMVQLGNRHGCEFDGWGAPIPDS